MPSAQGINQFNEQYLHSIDPATGHYRIDDIFRRIGVRPTSTGPNGDSYVGVRLTDDQRKAMQRTLEASGIRFDGNTIDTSGNMNEPEGFGHYARRYGPIVGGVAATLFGVPGLFPGLLS